MRNRCSGSARPATTCGRAGGRHVHAKPLNGFGGAGVLEVVEEKAGDAYRCVYTIRLADAVYVLHAFQ